MEHAELRTIFTTRASYDAKIEKNLMIVNTPQCIVFKRTSIMSHNL